jgi:hypothetical protein
LYWQCVRLRKNSERNLTVRERLSHMKLQNPD